MLWRAAEAEYNQQIKIEVNSEYRGGRLTHVGNPVQVGLAKTLAVVQVVLMGFAAANCFNDGGPYIVVSVPWSFSKTSRVEE